MKKFIISMFAIAFAVFGTVSAVHAQSVFNSPAAMPTVTVTNATTRPCSMGPIDGCWQTSTTARPGDAIAVHVYYYNSSNTPSQGTTLSIKPANTGVVSNVNFTGGVASLTGPRSVGSANVSLTAPASITYMPGSARWYPAAGVARAVDESGLFGSSGFNIGTVSPGEQGVLVANFRVGAAQDVDNNDECRIDSFTADDYSIDEGDSTRIRWSTTGCDRAEIRPTLGSVSVDGSDTVNPSRTTTYTLTAYPSNFGLGGSVSRSITIRVSEEEDECRIDSFTADDYSIDRNESTTLRWRTTGADSVDISPSYNNRSADGSVNVSPDRTTTYTLRADCNRGGDKSKSITISVDKDEVSSRPQAITTTATILGTTAARLNGIAVANTNTGNTQAWFEWGPSGNLGYKTSSQNVPRGSNTNYYSDAVQGLVPGTAYFYRAVVQNQNGIAYGDIVRFQTHSIKTTVVRQPPQVIVQPPRVENIVVAQSAPSLLELRVESVYDRMCINGQMDYTVTYRNISGQTLENAILRFTHPKEITYISSSRGDYEVVDRTITIDMGDLNPGEEGTIVIRARVNDAAVTGNLTVTTATVVYTNTITRAQEDAIAYSLITVSEDCPNLLGASVFGFGSFLPDTLIEWLLLILIILALIVLGRQLSKNKEKSA